MESNILKTGGEKNLKFFESGLEFLYFDMLKNEGRVSNSFRSKKFFRDPKSCDTEAKSLCSKT